MLTVCDVSQKDAAEKSGWEIVWLKYLAAELEAESPGV